MQNPGAHAIVIGAGMAGLVAARMLADHYRCVTILERDVLPLEAAPRKGVPHGRHAHGLLARGREALEDLFPGLADGLIEAGAVPIDTLADSRWFSHGVYLANGTSGLRSILLSRPLLETYVRRRLRALTGVCIQENAVVRKLTTAGDRVTGVCLNDGQTIDANLVVDASGRHSRSPDWLADLGYERPAEDTIGVRISYTTRILSRRPDHLGGKAIALVGAEAPMWRFGVAVAMEDDRWIVTQGGYFDDRPGQGDNGFLEFARTLAAPEIADLLTVAQPLTPATNFAFPASRRWRYERLNRFPAGFLVFGDALSSFNPIYGQGMTTAALEGLALGRCLQEGEEALAERFFAEAAPIIDIPWQIAAGSDLRHPQLADLQTPTGRFMNWYIGKVHRAAAKDPAVGCAFLRVANLISPPTYLFTPATVSRVVIAALRPRDRTGSLLCAPGRDETRRARATIMSVGS
jgi:2-polyprenyl-6-methoxyphenol hydroxylase-like FAD-dependent oxidoreductase